MIGIVSLKPAVVVLFVCLSVLLFNFSCLLILSQDAGKDLSFVMYVNDFCFSFNVVVVLYFVFLL